MKHPKALWLEIDLKNKELPLKVADTAEELAEMCGVHVGTIENSAFWARKGRSRRYICVWIDGKKKPRRRRTSKRE